jgi:hypothetical protein
MAAHHHRLDGFGPSFVDEFRKNFRVGVGGITDDHRKLTDSLCRQSTDTPLAYRKLDIPKDAPFALKPAEGKCWGAFATRGIRRGEIILKENPLFIVKFSLGDFSPDEAYDTFKKLPPKDREVFLNLCPNRSPQPLNVMLTMICDTILANAGL